MLSGICNCLITFAYLCLPRDGDCFYYGDLLESVDTMDVWESCEAYCSLR